MDYWLSVAGAKGRKVDWQRTWRNWMRREHERRISRPSPNGQPVKPPTTSKVRALLDRANELDGINPHRKELTA